MLIKFPSKKHMSFISTVSLLCERNHEPNFLNLSGFTVKTLQLVIDCRGVGGGGGMIPTFHKLLARILYSGQKLGRNLSYFMVEVVING